MTRSLISFSLLSLLVFAACATTAATPTVQGVVTAIDGGNVTITPDGGGQPVVVNVSRSTRFWWQSGIQAGRSDLIVGHHVDVFTASGTQNASRVVIR
jgi:hypothetical protein